MKFTTAILSLTFMQGASIASARISPEAKLAEAAKLRKLQVEQDIPEYACFSDEDFTVYFKGKCDFDSLVERLDLKVAENNRCVNTGKEEAMLLVGYAHPNDEHLARKKVDRLCQAAMDFAMTDPSKSVPWSKVTNKGANFDKQYYDGNTFWNEEYQTNYDSLIPNEPSNKLERDAERVDDLYETVAERLSFQAPTNMDNFGSNNFDQCDLRAVMCCWVSDRQANDNNGNCRTPYDERCLNADPADNTEFCGVDMNRSGESSVYVNDGVNFFPGNVEGDTHCHGFAWGHDLTEPDYRYAANNLFYVSMYDHMYQRGYVRNTPGAPMCGCLEKMPVVSRSDCTEIEALEIWKFEWDADAGDNGNGELSATLDRAEIEFNACTGRGGNNDLYRFYDRLYHEGRATYEERQLIERTLVGNDNCATGRDEMMDLKGYDVDYPAIDLDTTGATSYTIYIEGGTNAGKDILFTETGGDVKLVSESRKGENTAKWTFHHTTNNGADLSPALVNIKPFSIGDDRDHMRSDFNGNVYMVGDDFGTGQEKWYLQRVPDGALDTYYIKISGGTRLREVYLSTTSDGNPDLYDMDDASGRQRWVIKPFVA